MGILSNLRERFQSSKGFSRIKLVSEYGEGFYEWDGKLYQSDIVRSCIRPKTQAIGKIHGRHFKNTGKKLLINSVPYIKFLLEEPNPYMTGQVFQEKMANMLALNGNAFALIIRDDNGLPCELYPINATAADAIYGESELMIRFWLKNGSQSTFAYSDIIHLRRDFYDNDIFGSNQVAPIMDVMNVIKTLDTGIIKAVKNSSVVKWLLIAKSALRPEDLKKNVEDFVKNYLSVENETMGAAGIDAKFEAKQVEPTDVMPESGLTDSQINRVYCYFNTNEKIIQSAYNEDEWNSYYESEIEPVVLQFSEEYTRKIFSRRERSCGNEIIFEAINLKCASTTTKLSFQAMVDRGAMTINEWRSINNLPPVDGGDVLIRRLDTQQVD